LSIHYYYTERCPFSTREQLLNWAISYFKDDKPSKFRSMKKDQLQAIWYKVQRKNKGEIE